MNHHELKLRPATIADLETLFLFQTDKDGCYMAAFTSKDPTDKAAYLSKMTPALSDPTNNTQTILMDNKIIGSVAKFSMYGDAEITYWIDKGFWGKGITTLALKNFLSIETTRPLHARVAFDNLASQRVLDKCGFERIGEDAGFANARGAEIEEFIYKLS